MLHATLLIYRSYHLKSVSNIRVGWIGIIHVLIHLRLSARLVESEIAGYIEEGSKSKGNEVKTQLGI